MAKKKSKRFIVPSINFITLQREKARTPVENRPVVQQPVAHQSAAQQPAAQQPVDNEPQVTENKKEESEGPVIKKPAPLELPTNGRRKSALSLASLKRKKQEEEELRQKLAKKNKNENLPKESFSEESFNKVWSDYIDNLHKSGEKILASILMADKPVVREQMIHVTYPNQMMKKELLRVRPKVLKHIRRELNNHSVDFVIEVKEENTKRFAYTPQEKYELLKEKNKNISLLRKTFNLEL